MTVYLIRHGQTQGNLERRYIGSTDQPLCPQGREALEGREMPSVDGLYVSPLLRCRQTAAILFPNRKMEVVEDLRECDFGAFEGRTYEEMKDVPAYRAWLDTAGTAPPPGGESREAQRERTVRAFLDLAARRWSGDAIALVVHGGTIMCLLEALEPSHNFYRWQCSNGGGFRCGWDGAALTVEGAL